MKSLKVFFSVLAVVVALGAAFATTSSNVAATEVWRKSTSGGVCSATPCLLSGPQDCSVGGFVYFNNSSCIGSAIAPRKN